VSDRKWLEVNRTEEAVSLNLLALCGQRVIPATSPIDEYYVNSRILLLKSSSLAMSADQTMLQLLVLGQLSTTENYFRRLLANLVLACPVASRSACTQSVSFGSIAYYRRSELGYALLENNSLSSASEIKSQTGKLTGIQIPNNSSLSEALESFDKICHIRHAAVHSSGELNARNTREMGMTPAYSLRLSLTPLGIQGVVGTCHNVVRAYNRFLYEKTLDRWIGGDVLLGDWSSDRARFSALYKLFYSTVDKVGYQRPHLAYREMRARCLS
jgi:hypothetical protein